MGRPERNEIEEEDQDWDQQLEHNEAQNDGPDEQYQNHGEHRSTSMARSIVNIAVEIENERER